MREGRDGYSLNRRVPFGDDLPAVIEFIATR